MDDYTLMKVGSIIFACLGILLIVWLHVRSRAREGIRPFEVTDKDKAQFKEMRAEIRRELNIWRVLAKVLAGFGSLVIFAGMMSLISIGNSSGTIDWRGGVELMVMGVVMLLPAIFLARRSKLSR